MTPQIDQDMEQLECSALQVALGSGTTAAAAAGAEWCEPHGQQVHPPSVDRPSGIACVRVPNDTCKYLYKFHLQKLA